MNQHPTQEQLIDYLHGELSPGADASLLLHLDGCTGCRADYEAQARLSEDLRAFARSEERDLPVQIRPLIWAAIESGSRPPSWADRLAMLLRPAIALPAAAAIAIAAFAGYAVSLPHAGTTIDAAYYLDDHAALTSAVPFGEGNPVPSSLYTGESASDQQWIASSATSDVAVDDAAH
jgi:predicted anti-sigma-YlaC factor YlaD